MPSSHHELPGSEHIDYAGDLSDYCDAQELQPPTSGCFTGCDCCLLEELQLEEKDLDIRYGWPPVFFFKFTVIPYKLGTDHLHFH